jgi:hypothetical protein
MRALGRLQRIQVALDALRNLLLEPLNLDRCEVAVTVVDSLEFAAIDGHDGLREQLEFAAQNHEAAADIPNARSAVAPEVGDGS